MAKCDYKVLLCCLRYVDFKNCTAGSSSKGIAQRHSHYMMGRHMPMESHMLDMHSTR